MVKIITAHALYGRELALGTLLNCHHVNLCKNCTILFHTMPPYLCERGISSCKVCDVAMVALKHQASLLSYHKCTSMFETLYFRLTGFRLSEYVIAQ